MGEVPLYRFTSPISHPNPPKDHQMASGIRYCKALQGGGFL